MSIIQWSSIRRISMLCVCSLLFTHALLAQSKDPKPVRLDERWWNHQIHDGEQEGFIAGYLDCRQLHHAVPATYMDYQLFVRNHVTNKADSVPETIETASRTMKPQPPLKGGEMWSGPHGFLDGGYWGSGPVQREWLEKQRGFVEGYLSCRKLPLTARSVDRYVQVVDRHYADAAREHDFIADVLNPLLAQEKSKSTQ